MCWNISVYTSPLILTFLYRRGYFVAESVSSFAKLSTGLGLLVVISLCMRGIGRSQTKVYAKFVKALEAATANSSNVELKNQLRLFDFEFKDWPVDFTAKESNAWVQILWFSFWAKWKNRKSGFWFQRQTDRAVNSQIVLDFNVAVWSCCLYRCTHVRLENDLPRFG